jgi:hypothetical protein
MAEENDNEENASEPKPFPPEIAGDPESETVAHEVRHYLWGLEPVHYEEVSAQMNRDLVSRCVEFEMRDLPPYYFRRVRIIADLYHLTEHLDFLESFLKKQEADPEELDRSIFITIILAEIGDDSQKKRASEYYEYLVSHRFANEKFTELIECLAVLGKRTSPNSLFTRMEQEIKNLTAREAVEPEAGVEKRYIEELADNEFFFIEEGNKSQQRILKIDGENERLLELIRVYLQLTDDAGAEHFQLWTQQQIRRTAETEGNEKVVEAFRSVIKTLPKLESDDEVFCKIRSFNAIEFFLGTLTSEESEVMTNYPKRQIDPLRYQPIPLHFEEPEQEPAADMDEADDTENTNEN